MKRSLIVLLVSILPVLAWAQAEKQPYRYPAPRGSAAWNQFSTYKEKRDASQVPAAIVQKLSTSALLETVLDYPLLPDIMLFNNLQEGVDHLKSTFAAFPALLQRSDLATACIDRYKAMPVDSVNALSALAQKGAYSFQLNFLEMLMAQPELTGQLSSAGQKALLHLLIQHFDAKEKDPEVYGSFNRSVNAWPVYRLGRKLSDSRKSIQADPSLEKGALLNYTDWKSVIESARTFNR
jgi:hypothetical protein